MNDNATQDYYLNNSTARFSVLLTICIGSFLTPLSLSATLVAIPAIAKDLNANAIYVSWIPSIFLLSNIISLLPAGRLADIYGRKRIYLLGTIIFLFASVLASFSTNIFTLLVFRAIQGIGAAFFFSTGMAIITSVFHTNRGAALGWVVASVYFGLTCGPFLGGLLTDYFGWQSVFLFQAPLALLSILLILIKMKGEWRSAESLKLNLYGASILAICLICFFIGISSIPEPKSLLALSFAACFLVLFLRHTSNASNPIVNLKIVKKNKVFSNALMASVSMYGGQYGLIFVLGLYLQYNQGLSPTEAGRLIMLQAIIMMVLAPITGRLSDTYRPWLIAATGCLSAAVGIGLILFLNVTESLVLLSISFVFIGIGFGLFSTPNNSAAMGSVSKNGLSMASALLTMGRLLGQMLGTAIVTLLMSSFIGNSKISPEKYDALLLVLLSMGSVSLLLSLSGFYFCFKNRHETSHA